ncbi:MAG: UDP-N-acetylmuramoyl-tripeptide--D-alanyl-D-alanine ligase [Deltaproteobacteria bacterium]|nr:UDP-N-acetylmuramoyl-tripeptide--D-alanyl-D-alanine ligase [Deltaproteobacteria bacterium]
MIQRSLDLSLSDVALATGGELRGPGHSRVAGISTDTRDPLENQLFVALRGERFDGHAFLERALELGASALLVDTRAAISSERLEALSSRVPVVIAADTLGALGDVARWHRRRLPVQVIALTGSNGKTTTKEILASVLSMSRRVHSTEGNLNNLVGVPMTLFGATAEHEVLVIEMGMNARGEIARMTEIAQPDVGLVLNVGPAHIGRLGSIEGVAAAKGELYLGLDRDRGICVANADDALVMHAARVSSVKRIRTFGRSTSADVRLVRAEPDGELQSIELMVDGARLEAKLPLIGAHNALNAAAAIAAATATEGLLPGLDGAISGLERVAVPKGRLKVKAISGFRVIDDCYNANTSSVVAAIETISKLAKGQRARFVAVLGEMRELGDYSREEHAKVGAALVAAKVDAVAAFGPEASPIAEVVGASGIAARHEASDDAALFAWLSRTLTSGDYVLVKGSRGIRMERFIEMLEGAN